MGPTDNGGGHPMVENFFSSSRKSNTSLYLIGYWSQPINEVDDHFRTDVWWFGPFQGRKLT